MCNSCENVRLALNNINMEGAVLGGLFMVIHGAPVGVFLQLICPHTTNFLYNSYSKLVSPEKNNMNKIKSAVSRYIIWQKCTM